MLINKHKQGYQEYETLHGFQVQPWLPSMARCAERHYTTVYTTRLQRRRQRHLQRRRSLERTQLIRHAGRTRCSHEFATGSRNGHTGKAADCCHIAWSSMTLDVLFHEPSVGVRRLCCNPRQAYQRAHKPFEDGISTTAQIWMV